MGTVCLKQGNTQHIHFCSKASTILSTGSGTLWYPKPLFTKEIYIPDYVPEHMTMINLIVCAHGSQDHPEFKVSYS